MSTVRIEAPGTVTFEIPAGNGKWVEVSAPPTDCFSRSDVESMNEQLAELNPDDLTDEQKQMNPNFNASELTRFMLRFFATTKAQRDAIDQLVPRQLSEIDKVWAKESGITVGESESSTTGSSDDVE